MTFSRANSLGWGYNDTVTSTQINAIDVNQSRAVDGYAGGTYTPSAPVYITGFRFVSTSANSIGASGGSLAVAGKAALGGASLPASDAETNIGGTAHFVSGATCDVKSGATLSCADGSTFSCSSGTTASFAGIVTFSGTLLLLGTGRIRGRDAVEMSADANKDVSINDGEFVHIQNTLTATRDLNLKNTGALQGNFIHVSAHDCTTHTVNVKNNAGTRIITLQGASGTYDAWAIFRYDGSDWAVVASGASYVGT